MVGKPALFAASALAEYMAISRLMGHEPELKEDAPMKKIGKPTKRKGSGKKCRAPHN
jgi:hypothetical protein